jgi:asparagine synthase (glutamine-hydrolysing)
MSLHRALYIEARKAGVRVMLDGVGGDLVFNAGNVVGELIRSGRIRAAVHEARWEFANRRRIASAGNQLLATAWTLTIPKAVRRWRRTVLRKLEDRRILAGRTPINPRFAMATSLDHRRKQFSDTESEAPAFGLEYRLACLFHPHLVVGRERYDRVASAFGIELRDPFLDLRVIQFCMSLPLDQLHRGGFGKALLRRAMAGRVPTEIIERRAKEHVGWEFTEAVIPRLDPAMLSNPRLANILNLGALSSLGPRAPKAVDRLRWFEIMSLAHWLARMESIEQPLQSQGE